MESRVGITNVDNAFGDDSRCFKPRVLGNIFPLQINTAAQRGIGNSRAVQIMTNQGPMVRRLTVSKHHRCQQARPDCKKPKFKTLFHRFSNSHHA